MNYRLFVTDPADAEIDAIADRLALLVSPEYAARWYSVLIERLGELPRFPRGNPVARENDASGAEIRRMLYYGPSGRRGGAVYRVLYQVIEPSDAASEGVIRVLHVWHGARKPQRGTSAILTRTNPRPHAIRRHPTTTLLRR